MTTWKRKLNTLGGNVNWYSLYEKQYGDPQKIRSRTTDDPAIQKKEKKDH